MTDTVQALFIDPPLAFARLGGSTTPQDAYDWVDVSAPRMDGETTVAPAWTLAVQPDGSVRPFMPAAVAFRDGDLIRPVAPFFELWARVGAAGNAPATWRDEPLTPALLEASGLSLSDLSLTVTARNLKAARRTGNPALAFGTFPPLTIAATDNARVPLAGVSPPGAARPMIPSGRSIPLGSIQMVRSVPQPAGEAWSDTISLEALRFRYTPAAGLFYGPPVAARPSQANGRAMAAVRPEHAFLNRGAGWLGTPTNDRVEPADTYDAMRLSDSTGPSLGVVDDTCEVHFEVRLERGGTTPALVARAVAFAGPPDFAPDRRPFLSVADEINDREAAAVARNAALTGGDLDRWVADLFERIYETVSLLNVDVYRRGRAAPLEAGDPPIETRPDDIDGNARRDPTRAMGGRDVLRNPLFRLAAPTTDDPLPLSRYARMRHRAMSDLENLIQLVSLDPKRLEAIVRRPFEVEGSESAVASTMRMPPFMRQSNALPLTLATWQYDLLMRWAAEIGLRTQAAAAAVPLAVAVARTPSASAAARRADVLARLDAAEAAR